jgi:hypothetical protein
MRSLISGGSISTQHLTLGIIEYKRNPKSPADQKIDRALFFPTDRFLCREKSARMERELTTHIMKRGYLFLLIGCAIVFAVGYAFFLRQSGIKKMAPSMIEHAAIAPLGSSVVHTQKTQ